jgi:hypothetical protein
MKFIMIALLASVSLFGADTTTKNFDRELFRVQKMVLKYQKKFHITNLAVGVRLVTREQLWELQPHICGASWSDLKTTIPYGVIWVLRSDSYNHPDRICSANNIPVDQENTVVHEFVHFIINNAKDDEMIAQLIGNAMVPSEPKK